MREKKMQGDATIQFTGYLADHPELKVTGGGMSVTNIVVMTRPRYLDKEQGKWCDGEPTPWRVVCFRDLAEHVAESCPKGARVMVTGTVSREEYQVDQDGEKVTRHSWKVVADEVGLSLRWNGARVNKMDRASQGQTVSNEDDPWATN